ncbi:hypothetical protein AFE_3087 [Acidithiobacillus ferrooxidans ATCC 23270]|uniref:Uncharacterized protein n=1 Tax=Acidithiobacillus ferrooxidans (strain ATCC 23270 / DSM 14882 / CIP 104768 / NCIMB 8455) TaxID=243159 RepID=B7JAJ1_ACIF2|nr:hypothetical protein AFE_3087 [Acidithiobacillus ferrooxidans ATCC 23270]
MLPMQRDLRSLLPAWPMGESSRASGFYTWENVKDIRITEYAGKHL